jgi:hypothetical protein
METLCFRTKYRRLRRRGKIRSRKRRRQRPLKDVEERSLDRLIEMMRRELGLSRWLVPPTASRSRVAPGGQHLLQLGGALGLGEVFGADHLQVRSTRV